MQYLSTRGQAPALSFDEVLLTGLARDGGLYVPAEWPRIAPEQFRRFATMTYTDVAFELLRPFACGGAISEDDLGAMLPAAYAGFRHREVAPLSQVGANEWLMELFHGPTLAFKDVAMQLLGPLFEHVLAARGEEVTIVGATSGDTGPAGIEAVRGRAGMRMFCLFPEGRVSPVQQRQMTTVHDANIHNVAVRGTFDDCQALLKALFNDHAFRDEINLTAVNSINWARVMAQAVYYVTAACSLGAPDRETVFVVPTGNFGDVYAGYVAQRMGLPIRRLVVATNRNDILDRFFREGRYRPETVVPTQSPSMDVQVASNFERLLFALYGQDGDPVRALMAQFAAEQEFRVGEQEMAQARALFASGAADEEATAAAIAAVRRETGRLIDPHTAVGLSVSRAREGAADDVPTVLLSTAHPAKFPDAVAAAAGERPALPAAFADLFEREERFVTIDNDLAALQALIRET